MGAFVVVSFSTDVVTVSLCGVSVKPGVIFPSSNPPWHEPAGVGAALADGAAVAIIPPAIAITPTTASTRVLKSTRSPLFLRSRAFLGRVPCGVKVRLAIACTRRKSWRPTS
jgi:hypothetical protein